MRTSRRPNTRPTQRIHRRVPQILQNPQTLLLELLAPFAKHVVLVDDRLTEELEHELKLLLGRGGDRFLVDGWCSRGLGSEVGEDGLMAGGLEEFVFDGTGVFLVLGREEGGAVGGGYSGGTGGVG